MNGQTTVGKYTIVRKLGEGGMGEVYEARHTGTGRRVALKVITGIHARNESLIARFELEARAAGTIESEHVVAVLDVGRDEASGSPYLVMEYLVGEDVQHLCERLGPMQPDLALRVGAQALLGLGKAHAMGIVHRDIKPANLFLTQADGGEVRVKVLDFGIAKTSSEFDSGEKKKPITRTGAFVGSPLYMSPEQTRGKSAVDHRTDLWSLGIVLYQMLAGRTPFDHIESLGDFIVAVRGTPVDPIRLHAPWVDPVVARAIERALVIDPAARYQSADEMRAALLSFLPYGTSITSAMLAAMRPQEGPATVMGAGTAMAPTTPGVPMGMPTPVVGGATSGPYAAAQSNPAFANQGTVAVASQPGPQGAAAPGPFQATPVPGSFGGAPPQGGPPLMTTGGASSQALPQAPARGSNVALIVAAAVIAALATALLFVLFRHKGKHEVTASNVTSQTSPGPSPGPAPGPGPADAGALPAELAALAGVWHGDNGVTYDAEVAGDALRFRIRDASPLAAQDYEDNEPQFFLRPHPGVTGVFSVEARIRPVPPAGWVYDHIHSRKTCVWIGSEVEGEHLHAEVQGERLDVDLAKLEAPASAFQRETAAPHAIKDCSGLPAPTMAFEVRLSRTPMRDAGAPPRDARGLAGWLAQCSTDAQCSSHNCTRGRCRRRGYDAHCHTDDNCTSHKCVNNECR